MRSWDAGGNYFRYVRWRMFRRKADSWYRRCCLCLSGAVARSQHSHLETFVHSPFSCLLVHILLQVKELQQPEVQLYQTLSSELDIAVFILSNPIKWNNPAVSNSCPQQSGLNSTAGKTYLRFSGKHCFSSHILWSQLQD